MESRMDNSSPESINPAGGPEEPRPEAVVTSPPDSGAGLQAPTVPALAPAPETAFPEPPPPAVDPIQRIRNIAFEVILCTMILAGVFFRFSGNNWSEGTFLNPDELGVTNFVSGIRLPSSIGEYFNTRISPLSPYMYYDAEGNQIGHGPDPGWVWGQWPNILIRATAEGITGLEETLLPVVNDAIARV
jgi:hypothetical protein